MKNTVFLYIRMLFVMLAGLYTVRVVLAALGETDYGIYNVVGGIVTMFSFISSSLSSSAQRYFSVCIGENNYKKLNQWFCLNINVFILIIVIAVVCAETVGLWFVNSKMTIPEDRMFAVNVIYQLTILSFCASLYNVPYLAMIIAHEKMSAFAYIGIIEAVLKLAVAFLIGIAPFDKLIFYGILMCVVSVSLTLVYIIYCNRHFKEVKYHKYWNRNEVMELLSFTNWHLLGTVSVVVRGQGINLLLNTFFNPVVNAARAIAYQVEHALLQLNNNFFMAVKPQIYKLYASNELNKLYQLIVRSTSVSFFLNSILAIPVFFYAEYILTLWLNDVPQHTVLFTRIILLIGVVDSGNGAMIAPVLATKKIRNFYLVTGGLYILTLPVSYVILKLGGSPESTAVVTLIISFVTVFCRVYFLHRLIKIPVKQYVWLLTRIMIVTVGLFLVIGAIVSSICESFVNLVLMCIMIFVLHLVVYYLFVISKEDKILVKDIIRKKILKK